MIAAAAMRSRRLPEAALRGPLGRSFLASAAAPSAPPPTARVRLGLRLVVEVESSKKDSVMDCRTFRCRPIKRSARLGRVTRNCTEGRDLSDPGHSECGRYYHAPPDEPRPPITAPALFPTGEIVGRYRSRPSSGSAGPARSSGCLDRETGHATWRSRRFRTTRRCAVARTRGRGRATPRPPNVVRLLDSARDDDYIYVVSELVDGGDLGASMRGGALSDAALLRAVSATCAGLPMRTPPASSIATSSRRTSCSAGTARCSSPTSGSRCWSAPTRPSTTACSARSRTWRPRSARCPCRRLRRTSGRSA